MQNIAAHMSLVVRFMTSVTDGATSPRAAVGRCHAVILGLHVSHMSLVDGFATLSTDVASFALHGC